MFDLDAQGPKFNMRRGLYADKESGPLNRRSVLLS